MTYDFDTAIRRRGTDCVKWDEAAPGELPMWVADMDFPTAPCIIEALRRRVEHGIFGYALVPESFYESIIAWCSRRYSWTPRREWMLYTSGVVPALSAIIRGITKPGDAVVFMTPAYNCFFSSVRNNGCREVHFPLRWDAGSERYSIDFEDFEDVMRRERPRVFVLCNPHNPSGRVWTSDELLRLARLCAANDVIVISDEIHCEFVDPQLGRHFLPFAPIAEAAGCKWVVANAPNKAFNIAGLMTAYIVCPDTTLRNAIDRAININEVCDINVFSSVALQAAYTREGEEWLNQLVTYIYDGYRHFRQRMKDALPQLPLAHLEGTYLAWLDVSSLGDSKLISKHLRREHKVWVNPGDMYGQPGFLRINLATQRQHLDEATTRIIDGLRSKD